MRMRDMTGAWQPHAVSPFTAAILRMHHQRATVCLDYRSNLGRRSTHSDRYTEEEQGSHDVAHLSGRSSMQPAKTISASVRRLGADSDRIQVQRRVMDRHTGCYPCIESTHAGAGDSHSRRKKDSLCKSILSTRQGGSEHPFWRAWLALVRGRAHSGRGRCYLLRRSQVTVRLLHARRPTHAIER